MFGGVLNLSGSNSYTGLTQVSGGTLQLGADNAISDASTVLVASGASFDLNGFNDTVGGLAGDGTIDLGAGRLTVDQTGDNLFSGSITGTGGLTINGDHAFALTGVNTYTGDTIVNGASLVIDGSVASAITLNVGATLSGNGTIGAMNVGSGAILAPGDDGLGYLGVNGDLNFAAGSTYQVSDSDGIGQRHRQRQRHHQRRHRPDPCRRNRLQPAHPLRHSQCRRRAQRNVRQRHLEPGLPQSRPRI